MNSQKTSNRVSLERFFRIQDALLEKHCSDHRREYSFIKDCLEALANSPAEKAPSMQETTVIAFFFHDTFSTFINCVRLAFYGAETDAMALARVVLENLSVLDNIISEKKFDEVFNLIQRSEKIDDVFNWKKISRNFPKNDTRRRLWGEISTISSHASPKRLRASTQKDSLKFVPKVGGGIGGIFFERTLIFLMDLSMFFVRIMDEYLISIDLTFLSQEREKIEKRYSTLRPELRKQVGSQLSSPLPPYKASNAQ